MTLAVLKTGGSEESAGRNTDRLRAAAVQSLSEIDGRTDDDLH